MAEADYALQTQKGIKKSFDNGARVAVEKYMSLPIFNVQNTDEWTEIFTSTEGFTGMRETAAFETPEVNSLGDGYSVNFTNVRYTNAYELSSTDLEQKKDNTTKVDEYITRQRDKALHQTKTFFVKAMMDFLNYGFVTTKYAAPDTAALYATHTWKTGATFVNNGTAAFSEASFQDALQAGQAIKDGEAEEMDIEYNAIVVKKASDAAVEAKKLFAFGITPTAVGDVNVYEGSVTIYEVPYITAANKKNWFLFDTTVDKSEQPLYMGVGTMPHFTAPIKQNNEAIRQNIEGFWKQGIVNMPYMTWGSTGAT